MCSIKADLQRQKWAAAPAAVAAAASMGTFALQEATPQWLCVRYRLPMVSGKFTAGLW